MMFIYLFIAILKISCISLISAQQQQHSAPHAVLDIYNNAPPMVQAVLQKVGFVPKDMKLRPVESRIQSEVVSSPNPKIVIHPLMFSSPSNASPIRRAPHPPKNAFKTNMNNDNIRRKESPYVVIRPLMLSNGPNSDTNSNGQIVLALPNDNIQILTASAMGNIGHATNVVPTSTTFRDLNENEWRQMPNKSPKYRPSSNSPKFYRERTPSYKDNFNRNKNSRFQYSIYPISQESNRHSDIDSEEIHFIEQDMDYKKPFSFDAYEDIVSSGGELTLVKAQKPQMPKLLKAHSASGRSVEAMKAILIEPKELKAKRFSYVKSDARKVTPMKATLVKAGHFSATKTMSDPLEVKGATFTKGKTHRNDPSHMMSSSNAHSIKVKPQEFGDSAATIETNIALPLEDQDNQIPPIDLQCGGNNDLGWCDLGPHYPLAEVSQIIDICEELVTRMYVREPNDPDDSEDLKDYSLSHNITDHFARRWGTSTWKWDGKQSPFKGALCDVEKSWIRPSFAQDIKGKWHVIIQTEKFPQRIQLQVCRNVGEPCNQSEVCNHQSQCVQKYTYHHLISFDPESAETCPFTRLYKFPTSCICRVE